MQPVTAVRPIRPKVSGPAIVGGVVATLVFALVIGGLAWALRSPTYASQLEITNDTDYSVNVDLAGDRGEVGLGTVPFGDRLGLVDVLDQGDPWVFEFSYAGETVGEVSISRADLEAADWTIAVPQEVQDTLERAGYAPSAE
ncbi:MAG: hypothetical protein ACRDWD_17495 [Acidimicrobiia bacterium]